MCNSTTNVQTLCNSQHSCMSTSQWQSTILHRKLIPLSAMRIVPLCYLVGIHSCSVAVTTSSS